MNRTREVETGRLEEVRRRAREGRPRRVVRVCATGCRALGALEVLAAFERELSANGLADEVALVRTGCQGLCAGAPVITIDPEDILYLGVTPEDVPEIVRTTLIKGGVVERLCYRGPEGPVPRRSEIPFFAGQTRWVLERCGRIDPRRIEDALACGAYEVFERVLRWMSPEEVIEVVTASGLRGRGGAGFPTGRKWRFTHQAPGQPKYLICNADEGDPGAFMDRALLEGDPHAVIEGMLIAAYAIGAAEGYIYVRAEYPIAIEHIRIALRQAEELGLLGEDVLGSGFGFRIRLKAGAGAFVCGEETALIASIEGRRGMPRPRPPFPAQKGLFGKPTCINNVETLANVPLLLRLGPERYAGVGTEGSKGTKIFALAGKVRNTGLVEVPMGTTLRQIVEEIGGGVPSGRRFKAAQMGGPSGGCVPARFLDLPIDYESVKEIGAIMGSGGLIVLDEATCMVDIARYFMDFCAKESCGKCPPCRIGTTRMREILERICAGKGRLEDLDLLENLAWQVKKNALCGLGQTAPNPVLSTLRYFRQEYVEHILLGRCRAAVCAGLVESPCSHACPAGVDVPDYLSLAAEERFDEALAVVRMRNPFVSVCGRVCDRPCEVYCRRTELDQPLAIRDLKRLISERASSFHRLPEPWRGVSESSHRVAVVGAGPAGLSCAYFLRAFGHGVTVFESLPRPGGMLLSAIPPYRLPRECLQRDIDFILSTGVELRLGSPVKDLDELFRAGYEAVFVGVGAQRGASLAGIDLETPGVYEGVRFLREVCLGRMPTGLGRTVVIGGGNVAVDVARAARRTGAQVTVLYRRTRAEMPAYSEEIEQAEEEGVRFQFLTQPVELLTGDGGGAVGLRCVRMELGPADESGRRRPKPVEGSEFVVEADTVVVAVGQVVTDEEGWGLERTEAGTFRVDPVALATGREGVFAGGDCVRGPSSVIQAIADGQRAACAIDRFLGGTGRLPGQMRLSRRRFAKEGEEVPPRPQPPVLTDARRRLASFDEVLGTLSVEEALREARRCLRCDLERREST